MLDTFAASAWGKRYPAVGTIWENAWNASSPFLAFAPELHKIISNTNAIESLSSQLRKIIKHRGPFPSDDAAIKLLWLAIPRHRACACAKEKGLPASRTARSDVLFELADAVRRKETV